MPETDPIRRVEDKVDNLTAILSEVKGSLVARVDQHQTQLDDHEKRLRTVEDAIPDDAKRRLAALERFRYAWPSVALVTALAAAGTLIFYIVTAH